MKLNTMILPMRISTFLFMMFSSLVVSAQNETANTSSITPIWWLIIGVASILLIAILMLSNVLLNLARMTMEKRKASKGALLLLMLLFSAVVQAQETSKATTAVFADWNLIMAATVLTAEIFVVIVLLWRIQIMIDELSGKPAGKKAIHIQMPRIFDAINAAVPIEREKDVLLDHNYDGIRELDNNLPPWWKYGFYFTIIFAFFYLSYYHLAGGPSSEEEYNTEMRQAKLDIESYMKKNALNVDENNVTLSDAAGITAGADLFKTNCATCHGNNGEGNVGPNLTDVYWIHGGSLVDIFKSIKYGWPAKGMKSWQTDLTPVQIKDVTSYVKSIQGTNPANAKAPQGDIYNEGTVAVSKDSTITAIK